VNHLTRGDYAKAMGLLGHLCEQAGGLRAFAQHGVRALVDFVPAEFATLSVCELGTGHRQVVGLPGITLSRADIASFDRHFFSHPLVRYHGLQRGSGVCRLSDRLPLGEFRRSALYADHYRHIGIDRVIAMPLRSDGRVLVSFVLNRSRIDFSDRERDRLELLRPHLAHLYRACAARPVPPQRDPSSPTPAATHDALEFLPRTPWTERLTPREAEVLQWIACGKTDADVAALLGLSPRTVQKHLEHIYLKLGVETRTAAAMRAYARTSGMH